MEFSHEREVDNRFFYNEEEDELEDDDRDEQNPTKATDTTKLHPFIPIISSSSSISLNCEPSSTSTTQIIQKEHMFEKVVTPSDVGKLNRLVIPKQHAEKYFPLDASTHDRGLLLNFEDRNGKPWRFRYSYWNSSQSYVMTKGWSRFVKEKRLDAGDTVSFGRGTGGTAGHRLFIDWKRRPEPPHLNLPHFTSTVPSSAGHPHPYLSFSRSAAAPWAAGRLFVPHAAAAPAPAASNYFYFRSASGAVATRPNAVSAAGDTNGSMVLDSVPVSANGEPKRLRLFGVNLEQPYEAIDNNETSGLLRLQLRIGGHESSSSTAKDSQHSPSFDLDM